MIFQLRKTNNLSNQPATSLFSTEKAKIERQTNQNFCGLNLMTPEEITHLSNEAVTVDIPSYHISKRSGFRSVKYNDQKRIEKTQPLEGMNCAVRSVHAWLHWLKLPEI